MSIERLSCILLVFCDAYLLFRTICVLTIQHNPKSLFNNTNSYCPSVFTLGPDEHLHINKGRLHCFRKVSPEELRPTDCHYEQRVELLKQQQQDPLSFLATSVAFDWYVCCVYISVDFGFCRLAGLTHQICSTTGCLQVGLLQGFMKKFHHVLLVLNYVDRNKFHVWLFQLHVYYAWDRICVFDRAITFWQAATPSQSSYIHRRMFWHVGLYHL